MNNPEELNPYYRAQEKIYRALMQRHEADDNFRFTLRKIYNKNTYKNYFTGTEKSSYITFSLWYVKYAYPGASIDPLVFVANQIKGKWKIKLQLFQTKSPNDNQNTWVLKLLENINIQITTSGLLDNYSREESNKSNKMFRVFLLPKENRIKEENLSNRLLQLIDDITPIVNTEITKLKALHPTFIGNSVTADEFSKMISDRERRSQKVKDSIPTFEEVVQEVINIDSIEEESLFQFNEIYNDYSWVGDSLDVIGDRRAHYEIQKSGERDAYVFVHFEDEYCEKIKELIGNDLPKGLSWYEWEKGEGIRVRGFEMLREPGTPNMLYEKLKYLEENLGGRIRKVLQEISPIITKENTMKAPVNKILYGPPGTGKTYQLKNDYFHEYILRETSISKEQHFEKVINECSWWKVISIALIELGTSKVSDIVEHKWVKKKIELSNSNSIRATIWGQLQSRTVDECEYVNFTKRISPQFFSKDENSNWKIIEEIVRELSPEIYQSK